MDDLRHKFLTDTDATGRFIVKSTRTGRSYWVEPIGDPRIAWGSLDPATGKQMYKKGAGKYKGSVEEKESLITDENGFDSITSLKIGQSPLAYIDSIDDQYPDRI